MRREARWESEPANWWCRASSSGEITGVNPAASTVEAAAWMVAGETKRAGATSIILSPGLRYLGLIELMKASYGRSMKNFV